MAAMQVALQKTCGGQAGALMIDAWYEQRIRTFAVCGWPAPSRRSVEQSTIGTMWERWEVCALSQLISITPLSRL